MQDEMEDKYKDYFSLPHEEWRDLLSNMKEKDNRKQATSQIKRLTTSKVAPANSDNNASTKVPFKKKARTGFQPSWKKKGNQTPNNKGSQRYCVMWKNSVMPERMYILHSSENCFRRRSN